MKAGTPDEEEEEVMVMGGAEAPATPPSREPSSWLRSGGRAWPLPVCDWPCGAPFSEVGGAAGPEEEEEKEKEEEEEDDDEEVCVLVFPVEKKNRKIVIFNQLQFAFINNLYRSFLIIRIFL